MNWCRVLHAVLNTNSATAIRNVKRQMQLYEMKEEKKAHTQIHEK